MTRRKIVKTIILTFCLCFSFETLAESGWELIADNTQKIYDQFHPYSNYNANDPKQKWTPFFNFPKNIKEGNKVSTPDGLLEISYVGEFKEVIHKNISGRYYSNIKFKEYQDYTLSGFVFRLTSSNKADGFLLPINLFKKLDESYRVTSILQTINSLLFLPAAQATTTGGCDNNVDSLYAKCMQKAISIGCKNGSFCIHTRNCMNTPVGPGITSGCGKQAADSAKACDDYENRESDPEFQKCIKDKKSDCWTDAMQETLKEFTDWISKASQEEILFQLSAASRSEFDDIRAFMDVKATDEECHKKANSECNEEAKDQFDQNTADIDKKFREDLEKCCECEHCHSTTPQQTTIGN